MNQTTIEDYHWLTSAEAAPWLMQASRVESPLPPHVVERFRRSLSAQRTHLILKQVELRRRAGLRFHSAERMFFTDKGLQQATDDRIARYKAVQFAAAGICRVADYCCGIGGDLLQLAAQFRVTGFDSDLVAVTLANANLSATKTPGSTAEHKDVRQIDVAEFDAWHIDPDRRPGATRTTRADRFQPNATAISQWLQRNQHAAVKLAPATRPPVAWLQQAELEWIGHNRQCQQLLARFGKLTSHPAARTATTLDDQGRVLHTVTGSGDIRVATAEGIGRFLYEPNPAIIAARLTNAFAVECGLHPVHPNIAFLTGDQWIESPGLACFEVQHVAPFHFKKLRAHLQAANIGRLEIKKRGVNLEPAELRQKLKTAGEVPATVLVFPHGKQVVAAIARRAAPGGGERRRQ